MRPQLCGLHVDEYGLMHQTDHHDDITLAAKIVHTGTWEHAHLDYQFFFYNKASRLEHFENFHNAYGI